MVRKTVSSTKTEANVEKNKNIFLSLDASDEREYNVQFLRQNRPKQNLFVYPEVDDISLVLSGDIVHVLKDHSLTRRNGVIFNDPQVNFFFNF